MSFISELRRRKVLRTAATYLAGSWLFLQIAEALYPAFGLGDLAMRNSVFVLVILFVPALIFSWVFEWTPGGFRRESERPEKPGVADRDRARVRARTWERVMLLILALAVGMFALDRFVLDPARDAQREQAVNTEARTESQMDATSDALSDAADNNTIAVLPFVNMSSDPEQEYFSDGIAEDLLNLLSQIPELRVISRSSSFTFKGKDVDVPSIGQALGAHLVLEGSVRKSGTQLRVTAQLIEAPTDTHLWSETYDRHLDNIFAIQDDISAAIVEELKSRLGITVEQAPRAQATKHPEAHEAYLRGRFLVAQRTPESINGAIEEFERAIAIDPGYALGYAELAIAYSLNYDNQPFEKEIALAQPHAERALALDPNLAEAHAASGWLEDLQVNRLVTDDTDYWRWRASCERAIAHYEKAIELNPSYSDAYTWLGGIKLRLDDSGNDALHAYGKALELNPLSIPALANYYRLLMLRGRTDEARPYLEKLENLAPHVHQGEMQWTWSFYNDRASQALMVLDKALVNGVALDSPDFNSTDNHSRAFFSRILKYMGLEQDARATRQAPYSAHWYFFVDEPERAIEQAKAELAADPDSVGARELFGFQLARAGHFEQAAPYFEPAWVRAGQQLSWDWWTIEEASVLYAIRLAAGDEDGVEEVLSAMQDYVRWIDLRQEKGSIATYSRGVATFLAGKEQEGLEIMNQAIAMGYRWPFKAAWMHPITDHPGFARIEATHRAWQAEQRSRFLSVVCDGNPYDSVWQPQADTCETFAEP